MALAIDSVLYTHRPDGAYFVLLLIDKGMNHIEHGIMRAERVEKRLTDPAMSVQTVPAIHNT